MVITLTVDGVLGTEIEVVTWLTTEEAVVAEEALLLVFFDEVLLLSLELSSLEENSTELGCDDCLDRIDCPEAGAITGKEEESTLADSLFELIGVKTGCSLSMSEVKAIEPPVINTALNTTKIILNPVFTLPAILSQIRV